MMYTCIRCGKQFEAKHRTSICTECKIQKCIICGKEFELKTPYTALTCSPKCRGIYRKESGIAKAASSRAKDTVRMKYGVDNPGKMELKPRKCLFCGNEYTPNSSRQKYCGDDYGPCPVCGKLTKILDYSVGPTACSEECKQARIKQTNLEKYGTSTVLKSEYMKEKSRETFQHKYGVDHYSQTQEYKDKVRKTSQERYGTDVPTQSEEIKQKIIATNNRRYGGNAPTSSQDIRDKIRNTNLERYGGTGLESQDLRARAEETNRHRYGVSNPLQSQELREKGKKTSIEKYGTEHPMQSKQIQDKVVATNLERYGTKSTLNAPEISERIKQTWIDNYGVDNPFKSSEVQSHIHDTLIDRYGVDNPMKCPEIRDKAKATSYERYGSDYYVQSDAYLERRMTDPSKFEEFKQFKDDVISYIESHDLESSTLSELASILGVNLATVSNYVIQQGAEHLIRHTKSNMEDEVYDYLYNGLKISNIRRCDKTIIHPNELDFYLPEYKIAIECNPTYTHNSSVSTCWNSEYIIPYTYHRDKTIQCTEKGVSLIHIFGTDWTYRKDIIKSMLSYRLGRIYDKCYARRLSILNVSSDDAYRFLEENHIQGNTYGKVRLGLYSGNLLISLMVFSHESNKTNSWILSRFCTKLFTTCSGGASKLFKYFVDNYNPDSVISYSDMSYTTGGMYEKLGFKLDYTLPPTYRWVDTKTDIAYNRERFQKSRILRYFDDVTEEDIKNHTEDELMVSHGYVKLYNSGMIRWRWNR